MANGPAKMLTDLGITEEMMHVRKAGMLPYVTIAGGILVVAASLVVLLGNELTQARKAKGARKGPFPSGGKNFRRRIPGQSIDSAPAHVISHAP